MDRFQGREWSRVGKADMRNVTPPVLLWSVVDKGVGAGYMGGARNAPASVARNSLYYMHCVLLEETCAETFGGSFCGVRRSRYGCRRFFVFNKQQVQQD